jgi:hypothetical protein
MTVGCLEETPGLHLCGREREGREEGEREERERRKNYLVINVGNY